MPIETKNVLAKLSEKPSEELNPDEAAETVTTTHPIDENAAAKLIHKYSIYHAGVAFALGPIAGIALTPMTLNMISKLMDLCGYNRTAVQNFTKYAMRFIALLAGIGIAQIIAGLIPGIGNLSNAISSFVVTQIIGRATLILVKSGFHRKFEDITKDEWKEIIDKIFVFDYMTENEKENLAEWLVKLFNGANDQEINAAKRAITVIMTNYASKLVNRSNEINQEIENKLLNIVHSEQFQGVSEEDKTAFALCMATVLGRTSTEEQRLKAQTEMKKNFRPL